MASGPLGPWRAKCARVLGRLAGSLVDRPDPLSGHVPTTTDVGPEAMYQKVLSGSSRRAKVERRLTRCRVGDLATGEGWQRDHAWCAGELSRDEGAVDGTSPPDGARLGAELQDIIRRVEVPHFYTL